MSRLTALTVVLVFVGFALVGCTKYYRVSDPSTGRAYYTTKVNDKWGDKIEFIDMNTGEKVVMQEHAVVEVTEQEAKTAAKRPEAPKPTAPPAPAPAPAPATPDPSKQ